MSQMVGATLAALCLWLLMSESVALSLTTNGLTMEEMSPAATIWLETFPNTSNGIMNIWTASLAEGVGVFLLVLVIFSMTEGCNVGRPSNDLFPIFIGFAVSAIIGTIGPLTNAGLNPARDLGPRLVGYLVGWKNLAFSWENSMVYVVAPFIGAGLAALLFIKFVEPMQHTKNQCC